MKSSFLRPIEKARDPEKEASWRLTWTTQMAPAAAAMPHPAAAWISTDWIFGFKDLSAPPPPPGITASISLSLYRINFSPTKILKTKWRSIINADECFPPLKGTSFDTLLFTLAAVLRVKTWTTCRLCCFPKMLKPTPDPNPNDLS